MPEWWDYFNNHVIIHGYKDDDSQLYLNLEVGNITDTGKYTFYSNLLERQWGNFLGTKEYWADTLKTGYLHILRLDLVYGIVSGTFEMDLYDKYHLHGDDTLHITEGRFDIHM